ncbi:hypothetical protein AB1Y20_022427 [Prymnesium parvum]|uniref:cGMP-dependent protein kinase n=1 Tax=Prymnesium parvum TaxID=97485 RepID=A0AB34JGA2_PRYPA|eukprot:CAMPEP_0182835044 /NCGR_PEP_ID=MMETSP0006_2-20121128/21276_1 /TAXON_ID=97485 /ORGANISM="Prymnesium parvum, Strain Texoma1" /LENGTH=603 /DNA_ID=CAMNT_0024963407 /DNA_START=182 /DNA_END=1993 /DNA_ORIENTATION=+
MGCAQSVDMPVADKLEHMRRTPFLLYLDEADLECLARAFSLYRFEPREMLPESTFYYLVEGTICVWAGEEKLCTKREGAFFSYNFRPQSRVRRSTADRRTSSQRFSRKEDAAWIRGEPATKLVADSPGVILIARSNALSKFTNRNENCERAVQSMQWASLEASLNLVPFIRDAQLNHDQLQTLGELYTFQAVEKGTKIVEQGSDATDFFIVINGAVEVVRDMSKIKSRSSQEVDEDSIQVSMGPEDLVKIDELGKGTYFGEMALVVKEPRSAHVFAMERTLLARISKEHFHASLKVAPQIEEKVLTHCKFRLYQKFRQTQVPIFADLSDSRLNEAADKSIIKEFQPGEVICSQGEEGKSFHVIVGGTVVVESIPAGESGGEGGGFQKRTLREASYFGEISLLLDDTPITATCIAGSAGCTLLMLDRSVFMSLFRDDPHVRAELCLKVLGRGCTLEHVLLHPRARRLFEKLLKDEYADEHLEFYDLALEFDSLADDEKKKLARTLCDKYVKEGAPRQVNLPAEMRLDVLRHEQAGELNGLFQAAVKEVYQLMARDPFRRFKDMDAFNGFLAGVGSYKIAERFQGSAKPYRSLTPYSLKVVGLPV